MNRRLVMWAFAIAVVASVFRFVHLDARPMHADEAVLADKFGSLLEHGSYTYDPAEYHGTMLAYVTLAPAYLTGQRTYTSLMEWTLRAMPALAGVLLALAPLLFVGVIGELGAIAAAVLIAVSPSCVFYSRYYIPEMLLALFTALFLISLWHAARSAALWPWIAAGASAAAALATKETAAIALCAAAIPFLWLMRPRISAWFFVTFAVVLIGLINPLQLARSYSFYWERGTAGSVHAHPVTYYFGLLIRDPVFALALIGLCMPSDQKFVTVLKWYALALCVVYSAIPYKTPWCVVSIVFALALMAGSGVAHLAKWKRTPTAVLFSVSAAWLAWQAWDASVLRPSDPAIPWVYAQTGTDVLTIRDVVARYAGASPEANNIRIGVYTTENLWPLPWYFRSYPNVRWSREVALAGAAPPIVLASPEMEPALQRKFYEGPPPGQRELYMNLFRDAVYLRPGVQVRGYVRKALWDRVN